MHLVTIPEGISEPVPSIGGNLMEPGKRYVATNAFAGQILTSRYRVVIHGEIWTLRYLVKAEPCTITPFDPSKDWNDKHIWLYRGGGFGDLIMLTPLIREIRARWPKSILHVACGKDYHCIFDGLDVIPELAPIPEDTLPDIDALIDFEEVIEGNPEAIRVHMAQLYAHRAGMHLKDITPDFIITKKEKDWALQEYPRNARPRIGMQLLASAFCRTYPDMGKIMVGLSATADVYLVGAPGQIATKGTNEHVYNLMEDNLNFRQSVAVASTCDVCVSPDSALIHVCSALDIPCVALYGPFPSELRITGKRTFVFEGKAPCAPCFFHAEKQDEFPYKMPCFEKKRCVALESIDYNEVVEKTLSLAHGLESPS